TAIPTKDKTGAFEKLQGSRIGEIMTTLLVGFMSKRIIERKIPDFDIHAHSIKESKQMARDLRFIIKNGNEDEKWWATTPTGGDESAIKTIIKANVDHIKARQKT